MRGHANSGPAVVVYRSPLVGVGGSVSKALPPHMRSSARPPVFHSRPVSMQRSVMHHRSESFERRASASRCRSIFVWWRGYENFSEMRGIACLYLAILVGFGGLGLLLAWGVIHHRHDYITCTAANELAEAFSVLTNGTCPSDSAQRNVTARALLNTIPVGLGSGGSSLHCDVKDLFGCTSVEISEIREAGDTAYDKAMNTALLYGGLIGGLGMSVFYTIVGCCVAHCDS